MLNADIEYHTTTFTLCNGLWCSWLGFSFARWYKFWFCTNMNISHKQIVYLLLSTRVKFIMKFVSLIKLHSTNSALAGSCRGGRSSSCLKSVVNVCLRKVHDTMQSVGGIFRAAVTILLFWGLFSRLYQFHWSFNGWGWWRRMIVVYVDMLMK